MQFINKLFRTYEINSVLQALTFTDIYVFDAKELRPKLASVEYLEEVTCPAITIDVKGHQVSLPSSWHVMIMDTETFTIDTIPVCLSQVYENIAPGFTFVNQSGILKMTKPVRSKMLGISYSEDGVFVHPAISKNMAFIIPVGDATILAGPHDLSRYISKLTIGDLDLTS
jgi:hypothetical protein